MWPMWRARARVYCFQAERARDGVVFQTENDDVAHAICARGCDVVITGVVVLRAPSVRSISIVRDVLCVLVFAFGWSEAKRIPQPKCVGNISTRLHTNKAVKVENIQRRLSAHARIATGDPNLSYRRDGFNC